MNYFSIILIALPLLISLILLNGLKVKANFLKINLTRVTGLLQSFQKDEILYRFQELNEILNSDNFIADQWQLYKDNLVFSDSIIYKSKNDSLRFDAASESLSTVYSTSLPQQFFNEESVIKKNINIRLASEMPKIIANIGIIATLAFVTFKFMTIDSLAADLNVFVKVELLPVLKIATGMLFTTALGSLAYSVGEKKIYHNSCLIPLQLMNTQFGKTFEKISSEKFLIELIKESKKQNNSLVDHASILAGSFKKALDGSLNSNISPYLENLVFGLNNQKEMLSRRVIEEIAE